MPRRVAPILLLASFALLSLPRAAETAGAVGPQLQSRYVSLAQDTTVTSTTTVLSTTIHLRRRESVFVEATGSFAPGQVGSAASLFATFDGEPVTSTATLDWRESTDPVQHSFDVVGATRASAGRHTVRLVVQPLEGSVGISATSNLSVFVDPAPTVAVRTLGSEQGPFEFTTYGTTGPDTPHQALLHASVDGRLKSVVLGSLSAIRANHDGDAMIGLYRDGKSPGNDASVWSVNDICTCADPEAPLFTQAFLGGTSNKRTTVSLDASEAPWWTSQGENPASYSVEPGARLVVLNGMRLAGGAMTIASSIPPYGGTATDFWCLASDQGWPGCSSMGTAVLVAQRVVHISRGAPGVVMFEGKSRVQADSADPGGTVRMWLTVDGKAEGSTGVQQLQSPFSISQRTIATSYLAAGNHRLRPGRHVVRLYASAQGSFIHVSLVRDLPLVWFG